MYLPMYLLALTGSHPWLSLIQKLWSVGPGVQCAHAQGMPGARQLQPTKEAAALRMPWNKHLHGMFLLFYG